MSKIWKQLGLFILIIACLFNIITKIIGKTPLSEEIEHSAKVDYVKVLQNVIK